MSRLVLCYITLCVQVLWASGEFRHSSQTDIANALNNLELDCTHIIGATTSDLEEVLLRNFDHVVNAQSFLRIGTLFMSEALVDMCQLLSKRRRVVQQTGKDDNIDFLSVRRLQQASTVETEEPWYADTSTYCLSFVCLSFGCMIVYVLLYETCFTKSTLSLPILASSLEKELAEQRDIHRMATHFGFGHHKSHKKTKSEELSEIKQAYSPTVDMNRFWNFMHDIMQRKDSQATAEEDVVGFSRPVFPAYDSDGVAKIILQRRGNCDGVVQVKVLTQEEKPTTAFTAKAGRDFEHFEDVILFEDRETHKSFSIKVLPTSDLWLPTRTFKVKLVNIVSGKAAIQQPQVVEEIQHGGDAYACVRIMGRGRFPAGIPEKDESIWYKLVWWYIKDRMHNRKGKFWKTLCGVLYTPFHVIFVVSILEKALLDWATDPQLGGSYGAIIFLAALYMISTTLCRWGDVLNTRNRGRTGGTRVAHRQQLFSKLMTLDHAAQSEISGHQWFYTALVEVEVVTMEAYWEFFDLCKNIVGLVLCLITIAAGIYIKFLLHTDAHHGSHNYEIYVSGCGVVLMLPINVILYSMRSRKILDLMNERNDAEEAWIATFGWLAHAGIDIYAMSAQELANFEIMYIGQGKAFLSRHQQARDYKFDTQWLTKWLSAMFYAVFMCIGGFRLYHARWARSGAFQIGDLVVLMHVYYKFGEYITKAFGSYFSMQKAAISIQRLASLLNAQELRSHHDTKEQVPAGPPAEQIELHEVGLVFPETHVGPMHPFQLAMDRPLIIPLGEVVMIEGAPESTLMSMLAVVGDVVQPTRGQMLRPFYLSGIMLPTAPVASPPRLLVRNAFQGIGSEQTAWNLAYVLGLDPNCAVESLGLCQKQVLALVRTMLVDPDILVLMRPLACLTVEYKHRISHLLRVWQAGGAPLLLHTLHSYSCKESPEEVGRSVTGLSTEKIKHLSKRSLILTGDLHASLPKDVHINLKHQLDTGGFEKLEFFKDHGRHSFCMDDITEKLLCTPMKNECRRRETIPTDDDDDGERTEREHYV